jgi:hypothetical protein
LESEVL